MNMFHQTHTTVANEVVDLATQADLHARAERRMQRGKRLVMAGFIVSVVGIIAYCVATLMAGADQQLGAAFLERPGRLVAPTLITMGFGTLLWLVGSFMYLDGALTSDPDRPDPSF